MVATRKIDSGVVSYSGGDVSGNVSSYILAQRVNVLDLGVQNDGTATTAAITAAFVRGGYLYFPEGEYYIPGGGPSGLGALATITKSVDILCHPKAHFYTDATMENTLLGFLTPDGGTGLPLGGIDIKWDGGFIDISLMRNTTSLPFSGTYPPANLGSTASNGAIRTRGGYTVGSANYCGIRSLVIQNAYFYAGLHWQTGGSDSMLGPGYGVGKTTIQDCFFQASRDVAIYGAKYNGGAADGGAGGPVHVYRNTFYKCFGGVSLKVGTTGNIEDNLSIDCVGGVGIAGVTSVQPVLPVRGGVIKNNRSIRCIRPLDVRYVVGCQVRDNVAEDMGAFLADGTTRVTGTYSICMFSCDGMQHSVVAGNRVLSVNATWVAEAGKPSFFDISGQTLLDTSIFKSLYNTFEDNVAVDGMLNLGSEVSGKAGYNYWYKNVAIGGTGGITTQPNSIVVARTEDTNMPRYQGTAGYLEGTSAAVPGWAHSASDPTSGFSIATNNPFLTANGTKRLEATTTGATTTGRHIITGGMTLTIPTYADDAAAGVGGLTTGMLYKTAALVVQVKS